MKNVLILFAILLLPVVVGFSSAQAHKPKPVSNWKFEEITDEMDGQKLQALSQRSSRVTSGSHRPELDIICDSKNLLRVAVREAGLVEAENKWTNIRYKFEDNIVHTTEWGWLPSSSAFTVMDGRGSQTAGAAFFQQMLKHKTLLLEFMSLREGRQLAEFDLGELPEAAKKLTFCPAFLTSK